MKCSGSYVIGCAVTLMLLIGVPATAQVCEDAAAPLECNGTINNGTALLKVTVKDVDPVDPGTQDVRGQVCDTGTLDDRFVMIAFRLGNPKDLFRCITDLGSDIPCTAFTSPRKNSAKSDILYFIVDTHTVGTTIESPAGLEFKAMGWDSMKVEVIEKSHVATVFLGAPPAFPGCPAA